MLGQSIIFIPDISGFTKFIHDTEINHSKHIIAELLEILIDANDSPMILSEIEGDALLFYNLQNSLSMDDLMKLSKKMYLAFHEHLRLYQSQRICQCGACKSAMDLTLKMVVNFGRLEEIKIKDRVKLHGESVIVAHRLLKNTIEENEYILIAGNDSAVELEGYSFSTSAETYEAIGAVDYQYTSIAQWKSEVAEFSRKSGLKDEVLVHKEQFEIAVEPHRLLEYILDFRNREEWTVGIRQIEYNENEINRVGANHKCIVGDNHLDVETIVKPVESDQLIYGEQSRNIPLVKNIATFFIISPKEGGSILEFEVYKSDVKYPAKLLHLIWLWKFKSGINKLLKSLKEKVEAFEFKE